MTTLRYILLFSLLLLLFISSSLYAQRSITVGEVTTGIRIDGVADETDWTSGLQEGFIQFEPSAGEPSQRRTEVAILHDESYLYVLGVMHMDSIQELRNPLTPRDDVGSSDFFGVQIDPFGQAREGYDLTVTAAGVQNDIKLGAGYTIYPEFNAVWASEVQIYDDRWVVEMRIPFNSIRFPKEDLSDFRINFQRFCAAFNENSYWTEIDPAVDGYLNQIGYLEGMGKVDPPLNLSFIPFAGLIHQQSAEGEENTTVNGGLDAKYVYKNAYTLDVSLIPDFSQAPSDDQIFNLSPFEVAYNENRQFFVEGTEIFDKGGYLYTRRIGGRPIGQYDVEVGENEEVVSNPVSSNVLSLVKLTGKSTKGLSVGFLNGVTERTTAEVENTENGERREVETSPLINYNSLVLDQAMRYNRSLTFINNSVLRSGSTYDSNFSALLYRWYDSTRTYQLYAKTAFSQRYRSAEEDIFGHQYYGYLAKVSGKVTGGVSVKVMDDRFDYNDFGFLQRNDLVHVKADAWYNQTEAGKLFSRSSVGLFHERRYNYSAGDLEYQYVKFLSNGTFKRNNATFFAEFTHYAGGMDFYEAREPGRVFKRPDLNELFLEYQTNPNKDLSWSGYAIFTDYRNARAFTGEFNAGQGITARIGQHLSVDFDQYYTHQPSKAGYLTHQGEDILFGERAVNELTNSIQIDYAVNAKLNMGARLRHYWIQVDFSDHFLLTEDGTLAISEQQVDVDAYDDNFNSFNVDFVAKWQFAPASEIGLGYKLGSTYFDTDVRSGYFDNLTAAVDRPGNETLSLKVTYFLDHGSVRRR